MDENINAATGPVAAVSHHAREGTLRSAWREPSSAPPVAIQNFVHKFFYNPIR